MTMRGDRMDRNLSARRLDRRTLLKTVGALGGVTALSALLEACGSGATTPTATTASTAPTAAPTAAGAAAPTATKAAATQVATTGAPAPTPTKAATTSSGSSASSASPPAKSSGPVTLNFYSSGDVNVQNLWQNDILPVYKKVAPNVTMSFVFSEHGQGDQATFDRIAAAKQAGKPSGVDIWETGLLQQAGGAGLIEKVNPSNVPNLSHVAQDVIDQLGGYGVPYRGSSVVLGYNSKDVTSPPKTLDALLAWVKQNSGKFTYCPPDTGGSGSAFVTRVLEMGIAPADLKLFQTGYDQAKESQWDQGWATLKGLHPAIYNNGFYPKGNVPVLQAMANGGVILAPVWSDMALSYLQQKLLPPEIKLLQIDPPFYGGSSYVGVLNDSQHKADAYAFLNWLLTPDVQQIVVQKMNGYPGVEWKYMPQEVQQKFADIAKSYSIGFSSKFSNDMNKQWYEKVAGTPPPKR